MMVGALRWPGRWLDPAVLAGILLFLLVLMFASLFSMGQMGWELPYLGLVGLTIVLVRSVPQAPGSLLRMRATRRGLVGALGTVCALLLVLPANSLALHPLLLVFLVVLDVGLGRATRRLASAAQDAVDEREELLRNSAHRYAHFVLMGVLMGTVLVANAVGATGRSWLTTSVSTGSGLIVLVQMIFFLPSMVLAWLGPDELSPEPEAPPQPRRAQVLALGAVALVLSVPFLLSLAIAVLPVRYTSSVLPTAGQQGFSCSEFTARAAVGVGIGARLPLHAGACWDGVKTSEQWGLNQSDCLAGSTDGAVVSTLACTRSIDEAGTLHFTWAARVTSTLLPFVKRDVTLRLTVDRRGHILEFP